MVCVLYKTVIFLLHNVFAGKCEYHTLLSFAYLISFFLLNSYPWAGERCDELTTSEKWYHVQISLLVISNLTMIPGVLFTIYHELYLIAVGLFTAAMASIFYHLCDTDTYCIFGLSFGSLQVSTYYHTLLYSTLLFNLIGIRCLV